MKILFKTLRTLSKQEPWDLKLLAMRKNKILHKLNLFLYLKGKEREVFQPLKECKMNLVGWDISLIECLLWNPTSTPGLIKLILGLITLIGEWIMWITICFTLIPITTYNALGLLLLLKHLTLHIMKKLKEMHKMSIQAPR